MCAQSTPTPRNNYTTSDSPPLCDTNTITTLAKAAQQPLNHNHVSSRPLLNNNPLMLKAILHPATTQAQYYSRVSCRTNLSCIHLQLVTTSPFSNGRIRDHTFITSLLQKVQCSWLLVSLTWYASQRWSDTGDCLNSFCTNRHTSEYMQFSTSQYQCCFVSQLKLKRFHTTTTCNVTNTFPFA